MADYTDLLQHIDDALKPFNYVQEEKIDIPDVRYVGYVKNKRFLKVRNLCSVIEIPDHIDNTSAAKKVFHFIRGSLLSKYGDAFLWKELEICFVILSEHDMYKKLKSENFKAVDEAGFSMSAMLGSSFIDKDTFDSDSHSSWGVYFSGAHYKAVVEAVENWCKKKKDKECLAHPST